MQFFLSLLFATLLETCRDIFAFYNELSELETCWKYISLFIIMPLAREAIILSILYRWRNYRILRNFLKCENINACLDFGTFLKSLEYYGSLDLNSDTLKLYFCTPLKKSRFAFQRNFKEIPKLLIIWNKDSEISL